MLTDPFKLLNQLVNILQEAVPSVQGAGVRVRQGNVPTHTYIMHIFTPIYLFSLSYLPSVSTVLDTDSVVAEPRAKYILLTDVVPVDDCRYKFHTRSGHPWTLQLLCSPGRVYSPSMCSCSCLSPALL